MALQKKDFIEIEFTGKVKGGDIFDTNIKEDLKKLDSNADAKPFIFCLGEGMFMKGVDEFLIGKEIGNYTIELSPENAFGQRNLPFIQKIPMKVFQGQNIKPQPGAVYNFDGRIAKILSVSGGRITADFNHPLAGKDIIYEVKILRKIENLEEKLKSFITFLFRKELKFSVEGKKLILEVEKELSEFAELFKDKFKEIFDLDLEIKEINSPPKSQQ